MTQNETTDTFCVKIDYEKHTQNPSRIFHAMSDLIESIHQLNYDLAKSFNFEIKTSLYLENIETGSLSAWLKRDVGTSDNVVKSRVVEFISAGTNILLNFLSDNDEIEDKKQLEELQESIKTIGKGVDDELLSANTTPSKEQILNGFLSIKRSLSHLSENDSAIYISGEREIKFNKTFSISEESIEELLIEGQVIETQDLILKIKKPDLLGISMWDFKYKGQKISAKILDAAWLKQFHDRKLSIKPGDSIRAKVKIETLHDQNNEILKQNFSIIEIDGIDEFNPAEQIRMF